MAASLFRIERVLDAGGRTVSRGPRDKARVLRSIRRILRETPLCAFATVTPRGRAHVNAAYYCASDRLTLFFLSDPASTHCRNLVAKPSMAVAVFRTTQVWGRPDRGLQLFGRCAQARGRHQAEAVRLYAKRFPAYEPGDEGADGPYRFYRFVPRTMKVFDEREFGAARFVVLTVTR